MVTIVEGVSLDEMRARVLFAVVHADIEFGGAGHELRIVRGAEYRPENVRRSPHYRGDEVDIDVSVIPVQELADIVARLHERLGSDYLVSVEPGNGRPRELHIQWCPAHPRQP